MSTKSNSGNTDSDAYIEWAWKVIENKYLLLKKLGHGSYASVWLCVNINNIGTDKKKLFAMKIMNKNDYGPGIEERNTIENLHKLKCPNVITMYDNFEYFEKEDDDIHVCLVLELMECSCFDLIRDNKTLDLDSVKKITNDVVLMLAHMNRVGYIHTDIKPENILVNGVGTEQGEIYNKIEEYLSSQDYKTDTVNIKREIMRKNKKISSNIKLFNETAVKLIFTHKFPKLFGEKDSNNDDICDSDEDLEDDDSDSYIRKIDYGSLNTSSSLSSTCSDISDLSSDSSPDSSVRKLDLSKLVVRVSDFGTSFNYKKTSEKNRPYRFQTRYYRAPEIILGNNYNYNIDMWSVGAMVFELLTGYILFDPDECGEINIDRYHIYLIEKYVGNISKINFRDNTIVADPKSEHKKIRGIKRVNYEPFWRDLIKKLSDSTPKKDVLTLCHFVYSCLETDNAKRMDAADALRHNFMQINKLTTCNT